MPRRTRVHRKPSITLQCSLLLLRSTRCSTLYRLPHYRQCGSARAIRIPTAESSPCTCYAHYAPACVAVPSARHVPCVCSTRRGSSPPRSLSASRTRTRCAWHRCADGFAIAVPSPRRTARRRVSRLRYAAWDRASQPSGATTRARLSCPASRRRQAHRRCSLQGTREYKPLPAATIPSALYQRRQLSMYLLSLFRCRR